jgi:integrase
LVGLRVRNLDLLHGRMHVRESVSDVGGRLVYGPPKNGRGRTVGLPRFLCGLLTEQLQGKGPDTFVFGTDKPMRHGNFYRRAFRPAVQRLVASGAWPEGLARLRFHDLRHSAAALMIANGEHPKVIQERLGHASITITMDRYGKLYPDHDAEVAERLEDTFHDLVTVTEIGSR